MSDDPWRGVPERDTTSAIVIHHTASPPTTTVEQIDEWHRARGWAGIGYHAVVRFDASWGRWVIEPGRPLQLVGAHARGRNRDTIGIAITGGWTDPSAIQRLHGPYAVAEAVGVMGLAIAAHAHLVGVVPAVGTVFPHRSVGTTETECPGRFPWRAALAIASFLFEGVAASALSIVGRSP